MSSKNARSTTVTASSTGWVPVGETRRQTLAAVCMETKTEVGWPIKGVMFTTPCEAKRTMDLKRVEIRRRKITLTVTVEDVG